MPAKTARRDDALVVIASVLSRVADSWRTASVVTGAAWYASILIFILVVSGLVETFIGLGTPLRLAFLTALLAAFWGGGYFLLVKPLAAGFSRRRCAELLARRTGAPGEDVLSAWLLEERPLGSRELIDWHVRAAAKRAAEFDWSGAVDRSKMKRSLKVFGATTVFAALVFAVWGPECFTALRKMTRPFAFVPRAAAGVSFLSTTPGDADILAGEDVNVRVVARLAAPSPPPGRLFYASGRDTEEVKRMMAPAQLDAGKVEYSYMIRSVTAPTRYRVEIGDAQSRIWKLSLVPRLSLIHISEPTRPY